MTDSASSRIRSPRRKFIFVLSMLLCFAFVLLAPVLSGMEADAADAAIIAKNNGAYYVDESGYRIYMVGDSFEIDCSSATVYSTITDCTWTLINNNGCITKTGTSGTGDSTGHFKAVKEGTCEINWVLGSIYIFDWVYDYAYAQGTDKIRVVDYVSEISMSSTSVTLSPGGTTALSVSSSSEDYYSIAISAVTDGFYTWSSSDTSVATVDSSGNVTAVKAGTATITCSTSNGLSASCTVTVKSSGSSTSGSSKSSSTKSSVTKIKLNKSSVTLAIGKTTKLTWTTTPSGANTTVTFSSSNKKVATVSSSGKITAKKAGTATITAKTSNGKTAKCKVTVKKNPTSIKLNKTSLTLNKGKTKKLKYTLTPSGSATTVTWSSSNKSVATVNSSGKITAKKAGTTTITAKTSNGKTAKCKVTVKAPITSVKLNLSSTTLNVGKTMTLKATISPSKTTSSKKLTWSSSNKSVATVNSKGKVTAKKAGTTTITVKTSNGKTAKCKITVHIPITGVTLSSSSASLNVGSTTTLSATVSPSNTTQSKTITWTSSNSSVASVTSAGVVTAVAPGTATITAASSNGKTATCTVTVKSPITGVSLNRTSASIDLNGSVQLTATIAPSNTTDSKTLTWTSSNSSVATVSSAGLVTPKAAGTATITVTTSNGKTASCTVTVTNPVITALTINNDSGSGWSFYGDDEIYISCSLTPSNAVGDITWSSSDTTVAEVKTSSSSGKTWIWCKYEGTAVITATASNGVTASVTITVSEPEVTKITIHTKTGYTSPKVGYKYAISTALTYTVLPIYASDEAKEITWSSSDESVMVVEDNTYISFVGAGTVSLIATVPNGVTNSVSYTVTE